MPDEDIQKWTWVELELYAVDGDFYGKLPSARARAEIRRREAASRELERDFRTSLEKNRKAFDERLHKERIEANRVALNEQLAATERQTAATHKLEKVQLRVALVSMFTAIAAAIAAVVSAGASIW